MTEHGLTLEGVAEMATAGHSAFSPSGSKMWLTCSGSLIPNIMAEDRGSKEAAEGTVAHMVGERWLKTGKRPKKMLGRTYTVDGWDIQVTEEMIAYVGDYVSWVQELELEAVEFLTETRVDFSDLTPIPNQGGTADSIAIIEIEDELFNRQGDKAFEIIVTDLKYGKGIRVFAENNTQGMLYAYGAWRLFRKKYNIQKITLRIAHPRLHEGFTSWSFGISDMLHFAAHVKKRAAAAWRFDAPRTPSEDGCLWCKVKQTCPAAYQFAAEVTSGVFDDDEDDDVGHTYTADEQERVAEELDDELGPEPFRPAKPAELSTAALGKILRYRSMMEKFFTAVEAELLDRTISGEEEVPGWKLVEGRTIRQWPDEFGHAYTRLRRAGLKDSAIFTVGTISPAQAEKKLHAKAGLTKAAAAKVVNAVAVKPPGKKSLVRVSDTREALTSDADVFGDDEDE